MEARRIYFKELECYQKASEPQKEKYELRFFEISDLPDKMQEELAVYLMERGRAVSISTIRHDNLWFNMVMRFLKGQRLKKRNSFLDWEPDAWIRKFKGWLLQEQKPLTCKKKSIYGTVSVVDAPSIQYFKSFLAFIQPEDLRDEREKDIWQLDKLEIEVRGNPIYNVQTLNFTKISQPDMREEVKKAIYLLLQYEKIGSVQSKMNAVRRFSRFLREQYPKVESCMEIDRDILEAYLVYSMTSGSAIRSGSTSIAALRSVLETVGKLYSCPHLENLFLNTDIPQEVEPEFKVYSDHEMKVLNSSIARMDEQIARCMVIHQMLGTRISDTLTLQPDCVYDRDVQKMIRIHQIKTGTYEKPISIELAQLIGIAAEYTEHGMAGQNTYLWMRTIPAGHCSMQRSSRKC